VLPFFEYKLVKAYLWLKSPRGERGQSTAEYVAVTAVAVGLAVTVIFVVLGGALDTAVQTIADKITSFVDDTVSGGGDSGGG
jgi:hypothetical protein